MKLDNTSITLIIIAILVVLYLMYGNGNAVNNSGYVSNSLDDLRDSEEEYEESDDIDDATDTTADSVTVDSVTVDSNESSSASYESLQRKMTGRNSIMNNGGVPVKSSYANGTRGGSFDASLDKILSGNQTSGASSGASSGSPGVEPMEYEGADGYAGFTSSGNVGTDDMFNSGSLLPAQQTDWFEVHNNVNVKNSHLINVYRPIGANTVAGSLRNASWDFRGDISNPKYVVSPWMQSTISPDHNIKGLC